MSYEEMIHDFVEIKKLLMCYSNDEKDLDTTKNLLKSQYLNKQGKNIESFINIIQSIIFIDQTKTKPIMTLLKTLTEDYTLSNDSDASLFSSKLIKEINKQIIDICVKGVKVFGIRPNNVLLNFYDNCTRFDIPDLKDFKLYGEKVFEDGDISSVFTPLDQAILELNPNFSLDKETVCYYIEKDDVDSIQNYCICNEKTFSQEIKFNAPINHRHSKLVIIDNYLSLAAYFGSIKCFKYLFLNYQFNDSDSNIFYSAIIGGNSEIIHVLHNSSYNNTGSAHIAMIINRRDILGWLLMNPVKSKHNNNDIYNIFEISPNLKRKYIKYLVRLNFIPDCDLNSEPKDISDEYYNNFLSLPEENERKKCLNGQSNINIFLHYCIKYHNTQLFIIYFRLMNEEKRNEFLTNKRINNVYKSSVLEFCLFYRSYDIISYLLSFYPISTGEKIFQSDFNLSELYSYNDFQDEFNEQRNLETKNNEEDFEFYYDEFDEDDEIYCEIYEEIRTGIAFVEFDNHLFKFPISKNNGYLTHLGSEIDEDWHILNMWYENIYTGKIFKAEDGKYFNMEKPIIYLYPKEVNEKGLARIEVKVKPNQKQFSCTYPIIGADGKWIVNAKPNGELLNEADNKEYQSLFWESTTTRRFDEEFKKGGTIVEKEDILLFLEDALPKLGLNNREKNEFIQYWLPKMLENDTNFVRFLSGEDISSKISKLKINPKPETTIRVYMIFKQLTENEEHYPTQDLTVLFKERSGYTCVEWGGSIL